MKQEFGKCRNCVYRVIESEQHDLMLGMDTSAMLLPPGAYEMEYEELKYHVEEYVKIANMYLKNNINICCRNCDNCKSKARVEKSKKHFNKMIDIINCDQYDYVEKLDEIYVTQHEYFHDCGGF